MPAPSQTDATILKFPPAASTKRGENVAGAATVVDERRMSVRQAVPIEISLHGVGDQPPVCCKLSDLSEGGLFVYAPPKSGLAVGQRFEVIAVGQTDESAYADQLCEGCYATVVRTSTHVSDLPAGTVAAGLRFDQPLIG